MGPAGGEGPDAPCQPSCFYFSMTLQDTALTTGSAVPAVFLILAGYSHSRSLSIVFITVATGISGFQMLGSGINPLDLAPRYADILCAFGNLWASMGGVAAPYVAATLTPNKTAGEWRVVFFITSALFVSGAIVFAAFATAERQWWALGKPPIHGQISLVNTDRLNNADYSSTDEII